jgi:hypothetical protein
MNSSMTKLIKKTLETKMDKNEKQKLLCEHVH